MTSASRNRIQRRSYARIPTIHPLPQLTEIQLNSFQWFKTEGLRELFDEISPIVSFTKNLKLYFGDFWFGEPKYSEQECRDRDMTYAAPLWVKAKLENEDTGEISEQEVFMGDFPLMTDAGTFIINGAERVVVSQLIRSPGVYFTVEEDRQTGRELCMAKLIPSRGAWLEFETSRRDVISVKVDRKRKLPATVLLRAIGYGADEQIFELFRDVDTMPEHPYIQATIDREPLNQRSRDEALLEFYKKLRPGDPPTLDNAEKFLQNLLFEPRRYDLGKVGRYKLNRRLQLDGEVPLDQRTLTQRDIVAVIQRMIQINNGVEAADDIDHLGNRRVKTVGELIQNQLRIGLLRLERVVKERMSIRDPEQVTPLSLINIRPVVAATREFFGGSQLSQFMDQTNPLAELTHKRRLSALGPGGLRRERAGFDVRDVHHSHYGRICPIETPEGPNIGLIGSLATYARVNEYGFIETPYREVAQALEITAPDMIGSVLAEPIVDPQTREVIVEAGTVVTQDVVDLVVGLLPAEALRPYKIVPRATNNIRYLTADEEDRYSIAQASAALDERGQFKENRVSARHSQDFLFEAPQRISFMDVSPQQIVSVSASLIPFLEHDDANRALMGSNMQRQAVPLVKPEAPIVGTGMELRAALDSGQVILAQKAGEVISATSSEIVVLEEDGTRRRYPLRKFNRSNQSTCIDQRPVVYKGDYVQAGDVLADSSSTDRGELALGQNVLVAFLSWEGGNYEDAILISEKLVQDDRFSSIHIEKHETEARDTKLGPEEITRDIPNVGEDALKDLDEDGIIRIGAEVGPGDILVGKITPKGETELTPEEKLLRAIFGEKAREVKDSSLRLPHGERGKVVDIRVFSRDDHRDLPSGVEKMVRVMVANRRKITEGDKMAGRHGNKGVISKVVPVQDMPFLEDGTPVEMILNPLGVPARMNIGQILETHLGWAASQLGFYVETPVFDGAREDEIEAELARAWLIQRAWEKATKRAWAWAKQRGLSEEEIRNDAEVRLMYLSEWLGERGYDPERVYHDEVYARRAVLREWLAEPPQNYNPDDILTFDLEALSMEERKRRNENARQVCLREWLKQVTRDEMRLSTYELDPEASAQLGRPSYVELPEDPEDRQEIYAAMERISQMPQEEVEREAVRVALARNLALPTTGKMTLYDGMTGEPYDRPVTVGVINMLKLAHLVEDKVHARSTGPYSLVTQQPLGGKAQFGGQRFGEMEVWALEAYGAAYTLQEMLTVKSDDVTGRVRTYEAIVKGEPITAPGVPESFRVLVKELQSLGLAVEVINEKEEVIQFGKDDSDEQLPKLGFSISVPGPMAGK
ncbi:MAG: DNA-directed RNA polymerase subunit beta [Caldilineales bacterium]|nr:DNA-directed RNA polymerase subunit beta [Caldilineales bacterium]MDW8316290.1 DNA-directed RNA polymerase subunit beta [Anaerolineae bacterium]